VHTTLTLLSHFSHTTLTLLSHYSHTALTLLPHCSHPGAGEKVTIGGGFTGVGGGFGKVKDVWDQISLRDALQKAPFESESKFDPFGRGSLNLL
jgi:hypothetical protein